MIEIPKIFRPLNPASNLDSRYGTYNSIQEALDNTSGTREIGLTVGVIEDGKVIEYWFEEGIEDENLVEKGIDIESLGDLGDVDDIDKGVGKIIKVGSDGETHEYVDDETGTDEKVKYNSTDPTGGYLEDKIIEGDGISVAEGTGDNENKLIIESGGLKETITYTGSFTLQESDVNRVILCTNDNAIISITVPENLITKNLAFTFEQGGDEIIEIVADNNVTIDTVDGLKSFGKHSVIQLYRKSDNHYTVVGGVV